MTQWLVFRFLYQEVSFQAPPGSFLLCCVLGRDTSFSQCLTPLTPPWAGLFKGLLRSMNSDVKASKANSAEFFLSTIW